VVRFVDGHIDSDARNRSAVAAEEAR
jgi:hypothetical protein